ncbi:interleukin-10 receptor subunit alpha [Sceloporus undulatus]|uniref:interleukin-10 receptor subunit alpha n=1 Tax=Sceloporus undulatus TaxID=8520 RepID=UPI001C4B98C4|nr:interleukin-10 receptor subunit alpha [Sceloporus undulatus]
MLWRRRLLWLFLLRCCCCCRLRTHGVAREGPPAPLRPRFVARTFRHVLHWDSSDPGLGPSATGPLYDVEYRGYGNNSHWAPVPGCTGIANHTCDLSYETREPDKRYYARVRAVAVPCWASEWVQAPIFRPEEATLWLSSVSLAIHKGVIHLSVQLPISPWDNITYEDLHPRHRQYHAYIRDVSNRSQLEHVGTSLEFDLPALPPGESYCVSVEPRIASRATPANRTEEQCISLPPLEEGNTILAFLSLPVLGALAVSLGLAWAYVKEATKTLPVVLTSLLWSSPLCMPHQLPPPGKRGVVLQMERDPIQPLSVLRPKEPSGAHQAQSWGPRPTPSFPEKRCCLLTWPVEGGTGMRKGLTDSSIGGSTDSGICLQDPSDSLGQLLFLGSSQEGAPLEDLGGKGPEVGLGQGALGPADAPWGGFSGYQKQATSSLEASACCGPVLDKVGLVTCYLKQATLGGPSGPGTAAKQGLS